MLLGKLLFYEVGRAFVQRNSIMRADYCHQQLVSKPFACLLQLMPLLEAALYAKLPSEDLQRLLVGSNLGPFFKWTGSLRASFASAESHSEASAKWGSVSRRLMVACLRNKNIVSLKVSSIFHMTNPYD